MAFVVKDKSGGIEVVLSADGCVKADEKAYKAYLDSFKNGGVGNEELLKLDGQPTRFQLKRQLSWHEKQRLREKNIKIKGKRVDLSINYSSHMVRLHLTGIRNPDGAPAGAIKYEVAADGYATFEIMNLLDQTGSINELMAAITNSATEDTAGDNAEKKS